jgi:hypothetical protein
VRIMSNNCQSDKMPDNAFPEQNNITWLEQMFQFVNFTGQRYFFSWRNLTWKTGMFRVTGHQPPKIPVLEQMFQFVNFTRQRYFFSWRNLTWKTGMFRVTGHQPPKIPVLEHMYVQVLFQSSLDTAYVSESESYQQLSRITSYLSTQI